MMNKLTSPVDTAWMPRELDASEGAIVEREIIIESVADRKGMALVLGFGRRVMRARRNPSTVRRASAIFAMAPAEIGV